MSLTLGRSGKGKRQDGVAVVMDEYTDVMQHYERGMEKEKEKRPQKAAQRAVPALHRSLASSSSASPAAPVLVQTEFVFSATRKHRSVNLCGDWRNWEPVEMQAEKGEAKLRLALRRTRSSYSKDEC
jgi:hypothetical protein